MTTTATKRMPLGLASLLAGELVQLLAPYCERIEIAGSVRRRKATVKDIELVAVPIRARVLDLFGETVGHLNELDAEVALWLDEGLFAHRLDRNGHRSCGERYKRLIYNGVALDLFSVFEPAQWGTIFLIRTGSAEFSQRLMTQRRFGGWMPDGWCVREGALWNDRGELVPTPEEADVFAAIGRPFVEPEVRA